jgi:small subunit ribosomal protein S18
MNDNDIEKEEKQEKEFLKYTTKPQRCNLCKDGVTEIDYKDVSLLRKYLIAEGTKIAPRRRTKNCTKHQRMIAKAIKRARIMALLPFVTQRP